MKNFKSIFFAISLIISSFTVNSQATFKPITVSDLWKTWTFLTPSVYGIRSMNDGAHYTTLEDNVVKKFAYSTGNEVETLFDAAKFSLEPDEYVFNNDETILLIESGSAPIYRHSYTANCHVYDLKNKKLTAVSETGALQVPSFSPASDKVAFVRDNNLYLKFLTTGKEIQITTDGVKNQVLNGIPDWVYEEEFGFSKAYEWLPDGKNLAFIRFDESTVKTFAFTMFAGKLPTVEANKLYPSAYEFKYPKAGEANSNVGVFVYNIDSGKTTKIDIGTETDIYIPRIRATKYADKLAVFRLNRLQNKFELLLADVNSGTSQVIYTEANKYYFAEEDLDNLQFLASGEFVMTSERDGYRHLYLHNADGTPKMQLTAGTWDVTQFIGYDEVGKWFYYQSAEEAPRNRAVYRVNVKGKKEKISTQIGTNSAEFSSNYQYFINFFSNTKTPNFVTLHDSKGKQIRVLQDNSSVQKLVKDYGGVNKEFFEFKTSQDVLIYGFMVFPPNFDKTKKYPVIMYQYSGPDSQEVTDSWDFGWNELLAQQGAIIVVADPRGTGARGEAFRKATYLQLGKYETEDLIETAKYLQTQPYVDAKKIGIWGWSYGGFMSTLCMTKGADYFTAGIAVAPVTNWRYYDNIYTERFMRTPQENAAGYDDNSPINHVSKLKGKYLLVHGAADDNVHWQNSAELAEALVQADKQFDYFVYTNRNHSIYDRGGNTRYHLYSMMLKFWQENLLSK